MASVRPFALLATALALLAAGTAQAHGVYEASELEIHAINDEGTDVLESYGGYDIVEVFVGSAYVADAGDRVYVRLELYGTISQATAAMPWTVVVGYTAGGSPQEHRLSTTDGATFTHDFLDLLAEVEPAEHALHVQRAVLAKGDPAPGQPLADLTVRSYWGDDLRDVAPGGLPAPGSGGAAEYPEPTAIEGQGRLVDSPVPPRTDAYFGPLTARRGEDGSLTLDVANGLASGGQHVHVSVLGDAAGWTTDLGVGEIVLDPNTIVPYTLHATATPEATPLSLELLSDVGGRLVVELRADGSAHARGAEVLAATPPEAPKESPAPGAIALIAALAVAGLLRRT